jgi:hypothetical protein
MEAKHLIVSGGELLDYPGHWIIAGRVEGESDSWSIVRKPDGTFWEVTAMHIFPPTGGMLRVEFGDQILDAEKLIQCEKYYAQLQEKLVQNPRKPS